MPTIRPSVKPPNAKSNNPIITSPPSKTCLRVCIVSSLPLPPRHPPKFHAPIGEHEQVRASELQENHGCFDQWQR